nr:MAG TPA: hypothetical protein [Caudoviricetes sp.]
MRRDTQYAVCRGRGRKHRNMYNNYKCDFPLCEN